MLARPARSRSAMGGPPSPLRLPPRPATPGNGRGRPPGGERGGGHAAGAARRCQERVPWRAPVPEPALRRPAPASRVRQVPAEGQVHDVEGRPRHSCGTARAPAALRASPARADELRPAALMARHPHLRARGAAHGGPGLLAAIPNETLRRVGGPDDSNKAICVSGRVNRVRNQRSVRQTCASG